MTATNHALTGAIIGLSITNPLLALPLALLSHFICDALPHYTDESTKVGSRAFALYLMCDMLGAIAVATFLFVLRPDAWFVACWCAFLATSPDLMWIQLFVRAQKTGKEVRPTHLVARFHKKIQWFARPIGAIVEYAWAAGCLFLLAKLAVI